MKVRRLELKQERVSTHPLSIPHKNSVFFPPQTTESLPYAKLCRHFPLFRSHFPEPSAIHIMRWLPESGALIIVEAI
ncbi:hypothetical protein L2E82_06664 [Cichorium intybus]|uniref:Uncharacterized protein n=1 Tax=Cichorium intybus TaxID=13427 RepID=A0ACB9HA67_CICIN|nr:hypothetical protein L2E82_06664 [Cichorium intybus]